MERKSSKKPETVDDQSPRFKTQKTVMFKQILEVTDNNENLVQIAEKWDGTNLKDTLNMSQMLIDDAENGDD